MINKQKQKHVGSDETLSSTTKAAALQSRNCNASYRNVKQVLRSCGREGEGLCAAEMALSAKKNKTSGYKGKRKERRGLPEKATALRDSTMQPNRQCSTIKTKNTVKIKNTRLKPHLERRRA
jgi:hypothetical protein